MTVAGGLQVEGARYSVSGIAWMDHEWFTHQLDPSQVGWDWFSVQLDDNRELMLFQLRTKTGTIDPNSSATYVNRQGAAHHLSLRGFSLEAGPVSCSSNTRSLA